MTAAWYAIVDHVGSIHDLVGQEVKIAAVRMSVTGAPSFANLVANEAGEHAWYRVFPTGSQVPTRGGIMRVRTGTGEATGGADMLSADEMLERVKAQLDFITSAYGIVERERDHLRGEVQRWRERAAERVECDGHDDHRGVATWEAGR